MRYALGLEYDGSKFMGWQVQSHGPSVQACVEQAAGAVANHEVRVFCCGRTDTGVHASCQVAHFDTTAERPERSWVLGINSHLPGSIVVLWIRRVDEDFHARFSAYSRTYQYRILNRWVRPALGAGKFSWCRKPLDVARMHLAAQALLGEHDFSSFRAAGCQATHAVRTIQHISVCRFGDNVILNVAANGFLYHMVRNVAGSLMEVGKGNQPVDWLAGVLLARDRTLAAPTAAGDGLYFMGARYPEKYGLPAIDFATDIWVSSGST
jgi:tRNA pseudouridine38-40 synthase